MAVLLGAVKSNKKTFVFDIYDYENFDIGERPKLVKTEKIRRSNFNSAENFIKSKWSYERTGKSYRVEAVR
jgi:hypothetical protein